MQERTPNSVSPLLTLCKMRSMDVQEYEPYHDRVASTLNWEMGHQLSY